MHYCPRQSHLRYELNDGEGVEDLFTWEFKVLEMIRKERTHFNIWSNPHKRQNVREPSKRYPAFLHEVSNLTHEELGAKFHGLVEQLGDKPNMRNCLDQMEQRMTTDIEKICTAAIKMYKLEKKAFSLAKNAFFDEAIRAFQRNAADKEMELARILDQCTRYGSDESVD